MREIPAFTIRFKGVAVTVFCVLLFLAPARIQAWDVGVINSWVNNDSGGGWDYGAKIMVRHELCPYFDIGGRVGFMRSESLKTDYVPLTGTAAIKYPFFEGRFVPFFGAQFGYHFYTDPNSYKNSQELTPNIGFDWRFGKRKEWSIYCEAVYTWAHVHNADNIHIEQLTNGAGGSVGISYRF